MEEQKTYDEEFDMKLYEKQLEFAKKIAENQKVKGFVLSVSDIKDMATTMFIGAQQKISRSKRY